MSNILGGSGLECAICLKDVRDPSTSAVLECAHAFHMDCLHTWSVLECTPFTWTASTHGPCSRNSNCSFDFERDRLINILRRTPTNVVSALCRQVWVAGTFEDVPIVPHRCAGQGILDLDYF